MTNNKYIGSLIRKIRENQNLSLFQLSSLCNISKSYLSKIENSTILCDEELIGIIFKKMNLNYTKIHEVSKNGKKLEEFNLAMINYDAELNKLASDIFKDETKYLHSILGPKYRLAKFAWYCTQNISIKEIQTLEFEVEELLKNDCYDESDKQVFLDYQGVYLKNNNLFELSNKKFSEAVSLGYFGSTTDLLYYHFSILLTVENKLLDAKYYNDLAITNFQSKLNYNRLLFSKVHEANIYCMDDKFERAENIYKCLLNHKIHTSYKNYAYIIKHNLCWNLILQKKYKDALEVLMRNKNDCNKFDEYYFLIAWIYFKLEMNNYSTNYIMIGKKEVKDIIVLLKLETIEMLIENTEDHKKRYEKLKNIFESYKQKLNYESKRFYLQLLIEYSENLYKYKDALIYFKELKNNRV